MIKLKDIAREAGVTETTVSYILTGKSEKNHISTKTTARVQEIAKRLGYCTDDIARAMITGKNNVIGYISKNTKDEPAATIINGAMIKAAESNHYIKYLYYDDILTPEDLLKKCISQRLSGLIAYNVNLQFLEVLSKEFEKHNIPLAIIGNLGFTGKAIKIMPNDYRGGELIFKHLYSLGHTKIAHLGCGFMNPYSIDRKAGCIDTAKKFGVKLEEKYFYGSPVLEDRIAFLENIFLQDMKNRPTAISCANDATAATVITFLGKYGLKVPDDVSVIGYGNHEICQSLIPCLTTISEPYLNMGNQAIESLLSPNSFDNEKIMDVKLIIRNSTRQAVAEREYEKL
jgi:DNA-binding LacI/PurR family transcriptional regulator